MKAETYRFNSDAQIRLKKLLGFPGVLTPKIKLKGPTVIHRDASTAPSPGRFSAKLTMREMNLAGKVLGAKVKVALNDDPSFPSEGLVEGRAEPHSPDPQSPEPIGMQKSHFDVFIKISTPFGTFFNDKPVVMRAALKSVPPDWAKYRQYSPPRDFLDKVTRSIVAQATCDWHQVYDVESVPDVNLGQG